jgi:hypothetical protein
LGIFSPSRRKDSKTKFLVKLDHIETGEPFTENTIRALIEGTISPVGSSSVPDSRISSQIFLLFLQYPLLAAVKE